MCALPRETVIEHEHLIGSAPPFSNQAGSGFQFETSTPPDLCGLVELLRNVAKLALPLRAEAAESGFLHPVSPGKPLHPGWRGSCLLRRGDAVDPAALLGG